VDAFSRTPFHTFCRRRSVPWPNLPAKQPPSFIAPSITVAAIRLQPLHLFGKLLEPQGILGKGITVGIVQVALMALDRGNTSIFHDLERKARSTGGSAAHLALLAQHVCLALLRRRDDWTAAHSASQWFSFRDAAKAEDLFLEWARQEALKFEKVRSGVGKSGKW